MVFRGCFVASFCDFFSFGCPRGSHFGGLFVKSLSFLPERQAGRGGVCETMPLPAANKLEPGPTFDVACILLLEISEAFRAESANSDGLCLCLCLCS